MTFSTTPVHPLRIGQTAEADGLVPAGRRLVRRMSDLRGLFHDQAAWAAEVEAGDPIVYEVASSPVPETDRELPQSITTIHPGDCAGELYMTKGHQHPDPQGEIYLGLRGRGGLLLFDGAQAEWLQIEPGVIGYIPPGWAHRSVNLGDEPYRFLAVYPGNAGHDYDWVRAHGMGQRVFHGADGAGYRLLPYR